jgi:hypothetical protein
MMRRYLSIGSVADFALAVAVSVFSLNTPTAVSAADSATFAGDFGGRHSEVKSPNGMYTIQSDSFQLFFLRHKQKAKVPLILPRTNENFYEKIVEVHWSPDSSAFGLTDARLTRTAASYLYSVNDLTHPVDIGAKLRRTLKDKRDGHLIALSDPECIVAVKRWKNSRSLEFIVTGRYRFNPDKFKEFEFDYLWDLKDSFRPIKRTEGFPK